MKARTADYKTRVVCLRIEPKTGDPILLTQHPSDLTMSNGKIYRATAGYQFTGYSAGSTTTPAAIDIEGILELCGIGTAQIESGQFDSARCYYFATNWPDPIEDYEEIVATILGRTHTLDKKYKIEEMSLADALNQAVGHTFIQTCQKHFGGQEFAGCKVDKSLYTFSGVITAVTDQRNFKASALSQAAGYFNEGTILFTSGKNSILKPLEIKGFLTGGSIETYDAFFYPPQIGDTFTIVAGCQKRLQDCKAYNNVINFGGFSYVPTQSTYGKVGIPI